MIFMNNNNNLFFNGFPDYYISQQSKNIIDAFIKALKESKEIIYSYVEQIVHREPSLDDLIPNLKNSLNNIEDILFKSDFLEEEYYDFSSIKDMIFYIL